MTRQELKEFTRMIVLAGERFKDDPDKLKELLLPIKEQLEEQIKA